jgi:membrane associated rhomboid family serine protease
MFFRVLPLLILAGAALYFMTPGERTRLLHATIRGVRRAWEATGYGRAECEPFRDALRARTPWAIVTPLVIALNVGVFVGMLFGEGPLSEPQTLIAWGASFGPRTTNGEWWRLVTSLFVSGGVLSLIVTIAGLAQVGIILERLVGTMAFAAVYVTAGVLATILDLSAHPVGISAGASGAVFGAYGLLLATLIWGLLRRSAVTFPLMAMIRIAPGVALFLLYHLDPSAGGFARPAQAAMAVGFAAGLGLEMGVADRKPPMRRIAIATAAVLAIAVVTAAPLRGLADVRPELARVVAMEDRTAGAYETAVARFRDGRMDAAALSQMIDRSIVPEVHAAQGRLTSLSGVPAEHQPLVARAGEYLRLRSESWRLRIEGLRKTNMRKLREAERVERASLEVLQPIRPSDQK